MNELTHIDLFSGIGGFALAARRAGFKTIAFCEKNDWCCQVIAKNFDAYTYSKRNVQPERNIETLGRRIVGVRKKTIPIISDIRNFDGTRFAGATLLTGGFPCQPFSCAGQRIGAKDDRFLWPEMLRVISESKPTWIIGENVAGIINMELDRCVAGLEAQGYEVQPLIIPACAVDAPHRRERVWIVAHANSERRCGRITWIKDAKNVRESPCSWENEKKWVFESGMGRVANGIPGRVDRLRGLGNSIVPQVAEIIMRVIAKEE